MHLNVGDVFDCIVVMEGDNRCTNLPTIDIGRSGSGSGKPIA